ncbi:MAG: hypothetical protein R2827_05170 [Bdellovibrionales bacterium]
MRTIALFGEVNEDIITGKEANAAITPYIDKLKRTSTLKIVTGGGERDRIDL